MNFPWAKKRSLEKPFPNVAETVASPPSLRATPTEQMPSSCPCSWAHEILAVASYIFRFARRALSSTPLATTPSGPATVTSFSARTKPRRPRCNGLTSHQISFCDSIQPKLRKIEPASTCVPLNSSPCGASKSVNPCDLATCQRRNPPSIGATRSPSAMEEVCCRDCAAPATDTMIANERTKPFLLKSNTTTSIKPASETSGRAGQRRNPRYHYHG
jgi:hypothetical protein